MPCTDGLRISDGHSEQQREDGAKGNSTFDRGCHLNRWRVKVSYSCHTYDGFIIGTGLVGELV